MNSHSLADALTFLVLVLHIFLSPFSKVEESFSVQAMHDLWHHGADIARYVTSVAEIETLLWGGVSVFEVQPPNFREQADKV